MSGCEGDMIRRVEKESVIVYLIPTLRFSWSGDAGIVRFVPLRET